MRRKLIVVILSIAAVLTMAACGAEAVQDSSVPSKQSLKQEQAAESSEDVKKEEKVEDKVELKEEELGPMLFMRTFTEDHDCADVFMNFPTTYSSGRESLYYHMTYDREDTETIAIIGSQSSIDYNKETMEKHGMIYNATLEEMLPGHVTFIVDSIDYNYGGKYKDFAMEISEGTAVEVNGTEMYYHTGKLTYTLEDTPVEKAVVGYAAPASNGACLFWVVCGLDEDAIKEDADIMAMTMRETRELTE